MKYMEYFYRQAIIKVIYIEWKKLKGTLHHDTTKWQNGGNVVYGFRPKYMIKIKKFLCQSPSRIRLIGTD